MTGEHAAIASVLFLLVGQTMAAQDIMGATWQNKGHVSAAERTNECVQ